MTFESNIIGLYGDAGQLWLQRLPILVKELADLWNLTELRPVVNLTYNYVLTGFMQERPIVLKLRYDPAQLKREYEALCAYQAYGGVRVLKYDSALAAMVLEQIIPGTPLTSLFSEHDDAATKIAAHCLHNLHQVPLLSTHSFLALEDVLPLFEKEFPVLAPFLTRARLLRTSLLQGSQAHVLLHGDFHSENILCGKLETYVVIDPEGLIGNPMYDLAVYIRNPLVGLIQNKNAHTILRDRITLFATLLGYDAQRIFEWTYLQAVASAYWSLEDGLEVGNHVLFLNLLETIRV